MNGRNLLISTGKGLGYSLFFLLATLMFVGVTFPEERAKGFLSAHAERALKGEVEIGSLDVSLLFGTAELEDVAVKLAAPAPRGPAEAIPESGKPRPPSVINVGRLAIDLALWPLLMGGERTAEFEGELQGGEFSGGEAVLGDDGEMDVRVERMEGIRLGSGKLVERVAGYDLRGSLAGKLDVHRGATLEDLRATIDLSLTEARIVRPTVPTRQLGPIQLSDIDLGELHLLVRADTVSELGLTKRGAGRRSKDGTVIQFVDLTATGGDVELQFDDQSVIRIVPKAPFSQAALDVHFAVKIQDRFYDKTLADKEGEVSQPNKILRMALKQDSRLRAATRDGVLGIGCRGTVGKPDCRPETPRVRGGFKKRRVSFAPSDEEEEPEEPSAGAAERDKKRKQKAARQKANQQRREEARKKRAEQKRLGVESRDETADREGRRARPQTTRRAQPSPARSSSSVRPPPISPKSARAPGPMAKPRLLSPGPLGGGSGLNDSAYGGGEEDEGDEDDEDEDDEDEDDEDEDDEDEDDEDEDDEDEDDEDEDDEEE